MTLNKTKMRASIRNTRRRLTGEIIRKHSDEIAKKLIKLPEITKIQKIAAYVASEGEVDPLPILRLFNSVDTKFYLPYIKINHQHMHFYRYQLNETLIINKYGIEEPDIKNKSPHEPEEFDCVLMPLVAFDQQCYRLGRGGGYYDTSFSFRLKTDTKKPILIGLAYEFQKIDSTEPASWDVPADIIVTEDTIYRYDR